MPCRDDWADNEADKERDERLHRATRVACEMAKLLTEQQRCQQLSKAAYKWVREHEEMDRQRMQQEKEKAEAEVAKKRALQKLTPRERRLLGLKGGN